MPYTNGCWSDNIGVDSVNIENELFTTLRNIISKRKKVGVVSNIKEDIVSVKLTNLNVKEDMILSAATIYDFTSNGFEMVIIDLKNSIKYYEDLDVMINAPIIEGLKAKLLYIHEQSKLPIDSLLHKILTTDPFYYKLLVKTVN